MALFRRLKAWIFVSAQGTERNVDRRHKTEHIFGRQSFGAPRRADCRLRNVSEKDYINEQLINKIVNTYYVLYMICIVTNVDLHPTVD